MSRDVIYDQPGNTLSTIAAFLKEDYTQNDIRTVVNTKTEFLSRVKGRPTQYGLGWVEPLKTATSRSAGARGENGALPETGFGEYQKITGNVKYIYSSFKITGPAIEAGKGNKAAFKDTLDAAMTDCKESMRLEMQRLVWGDGNCILGRVATTANSTTISVSDPYGLTYVQADLQGYEKVMPFGRNQKIWIYTEGGGGTNLFRTVSGVLTSTGQIVLTAAASVVAGDIIMSGSSATNNSNDHEFVGVSGFVDDEGSYYNLSRTGQPVLQSEVIESSGDPLLLEDEMDAMSSALFRKATEDGGMTIFGNTRVFDAYKRVLRSERRQVNPEVLKSGQRALDYDGIKFVRDKDAPPQRMYWLRMEDIFFRNLNGAEGGWLDHDGSVLHQDTGSEGPLDAWRADWHRYTSLTTAAPANHGVIEGVTFTDTSA